MPVKFSVINRSGSFAYKLPLCSGPQVMLEAYGSAAINYQCCIPRSGGVGTTATTGTPGFSIRGGGSYARSVLSVSSNTVIYGYGATNTNFVIWANTVSNSEPTDSTQGVRSVTGYGLPCYSTQQIGQITYPGGRNGKRYFSRCSCCEVRHNYYVWGGGGGQAGPYGPGADGSSAYPVGCYQVSTSYLPGSGGGANGGTSAVLGTPGKSRWGSNLSGGGGRCGVAGNIDLICGGVTQYGSRGGSGGLNCYESIPTNESNGMLVITVCRGVVAIPSGSYNHVFTQDTVTGNRLYSIPVPVGTTSTIVQVLGAGWKGNASVGSIYTTCATRATAGGGGGGYARSQYTTPVTSTAVLIEVQVACGGFQSSSAVFINGVLEARAYTAYGHEGGGLGNANNPVNYARNGVVYRGGHGGSGYRSCTSAIARGGAGGGAAWQGGNGGQGANTSSSNAGGGGGGAAGTTGAGSAGSTASPSTRGGSGGSAGAPGFGAGGSSTTTISQGNPGVNGGGGQGGGTTGGASYGGAGSTNPLFGPGNLTAVNYYQNPSTSVYGPGGGGGGSYSSTTYTGYGGSGGNYGGGAGGGDLAGNGAPGLVVITFTVCGPLAAQYTTSSQSTSDVQFID